VSTACLSNTNHSHWQRLAGLDGRREYSAVPELRHRLASHLVGYIKPDPQIYRLAHATFSEAGAVRPEGIIFFDDLAENVSAARSAGWTAFLVDHRGDTAQQMREHLLGIGIRC
jgi:FMN phosphatase YigB (HAD superfamily)